jgi:Protein of unknown function (DUF1573)
MSKYTTLFLLFALLGTACVKDEQPLGGPNPEGLTFETEVLDYVKTAADADLITVNGVQKIKKGSERSRQVKFTNTSTIPITIASAVGSCGCIVPDFPKAAIMPGASSTITTLYDTNKTGQFQKRITITTNVGTPATYILTVKGDVGE